MRLEHSRIAGQYLTIEPLQDKNFPRHSAYFATWQEWKKEPFYSAMAKSQADAIEFARRFGYIVPVGF